MAPDATTPRDLLDLFTRHAQAAGAQIVQVADVAAAVATIATISDGPLRCTAATQARYPALGPALIAAGLPLAVAEEIAAGLPDPPTLAATLAGGTGLVTAYAGIAETGSLVLADDGLAPRLVSMLPDMCIVLLPGAALLPALDDAARLLIDLDRAGHRYVSFVTGPSRTADIERVLTIGVQGPKELYIIITAAEEGDATYDQPTR